MGGGEKCKISYSDSLIFYNPKIYAIVSTRQSRIQIQMDRCQHAFNMIKTYVPFIDYEDSLVPYHMIYQGYVIDLIDSIWSTHAIISEKQCFFAFVNFEEEVLNLQGLLRRPQ